MVIDASQGYRYAMDQSLGIVSINSVAQYQVWLIHTTNGQISFNDPNNASTTRTRVTVSSGTSPYAPLDGYLNPMLEQEDIRTLVINNGQLTANTILMGPLVFPYEYFQTTGGTDPSFFQPPRGSNKTIQTYVQITGEGLAPTGNLFRCSAIILKDSLFTLSYQVQLTAAGINVGF